MPQSTLFKRYIWLIDLIYRNDGITREQINQKWQHCTSLNDDKETEIPERMFHRDKKAIKELFGIEIVCNRNGNRGYSIIGREEIKNNSTKSWLLNSFAVYNTLDEAHTLQDRILFEQIPSGQKYLTTLIDAMRDDMVVELLYQSFHMDSPMPFTVEPYCLKVYKQRWYILGRRTDTGNIRTFALDRIKDIKLTGSKFKLPENFDAEQYYANSIGIIVEENITPQRVIVRVSGGQQDYFRSLPLHDSQQEIERNDNESKFELYIRPSYDLIQELLRYGDDVEVLTPEWLRNEFRNIAKNMNTNYNRSN